MIAKVVGYGADRPEAIAAISGALRDTVLLGTITNTAFLPTSSSTRRSRLASETHTGFLDEHPELIATARADAEIERFLLAAAALHSPRFDTRHDAPTIHGRMGEWRP